MTTRRRAAALAALAALILLASSLFVLAHAHHECEGEDCPVCARLHAWARSLKIAAAAAVPAAAVILALILCGVAVACPARAPRTPVSLKVKLSD